MNESKRKTLKTEDRISTLPDDVICHILSLLDTKDAVRTSALSTRWRYLFASVTVLRFCDFGGINEIWKVNSREVRGRKFTEFVNGLLNQHDVSDISLFDLSLKFGHYDISDVNSWINSAIRRNVQKVKVNVFSTKFGGGSLVPDLFTCKTLVDLCLYGDFDLSVPESVYLPNLKTCSVGSEFINDGSIHRLFSSCPKLEKLTLCGYGINLKEIELHIPSLKFFCAYYTHKDTILLNAPNLEYFEYRGGGPSVFCKGVWKSIIRVNIMIRKGFEFSEENLSQLANNLIQVKYLSLCSKSMELLQQSRSLPTFNNLTHLELKAKSKAGWKLLPNLLHKTPCLEVLVIHDGFMDDYVYEEITESVPICLSQQLKVAKVYVSIDDQTEFKWIKFLLTIARVLEKLKVYPYRPIYQLKGHRSPSQITKELLAFPRVSQTCQVEFAEQNENFCYGRVF